MSSVYNTEPPCSGKVVLHTTYGDIQLDLWSKEAPRACRNFIQLSLEGYYDNTIFHRIIKDFLIQGGDPTGTGTGGESIYGEPFRDEIHTRIRFNHRGQLAMANANKPHTNTSQFFITLSTCEWLNKKHTIFGTVSGSTIFNALRMGEVETDSNDRPVEPPRLKSVEVLDNPFDDIFPRDISKPKPEDLKAQQERAKEERKKKEFDKKYKKKKLSLLSFGDEEAEAPVENTGMKSSHDMLQDDKRLAPSEVESGKTQNEDEGKQKNSNKEEGKEQTTNSEARSSDKSVHNEPEDFEEKMRKKIEAKKATTEKKGASEDGNNKKSIDERYEDFRKLLKREGDEKKRATKVKGAAAENEEQAQKLLTPAQQLRRKYIDRKRQHGSREKETLERLNKFKASLQSVTKDPSIEAKLDSDKTEGYHGQVLEDEGDEEENSFEWMAAQLKQHKHVDDEYRAGTEIDDGMMTYDPVRDKEKPAPGPVEFGKNMGGGPHEKEMSSKRSRGSERESRDRSKKHKSERP
eukprot:gb/GECG01016297.1/.p1 GENE.gb/GECG01016297.1/~~gb/GECG01016297.1/.p1  ORF type:complete len:519 (+),score=107.91 gb/GECG01016297.1/:1-1557(+)